MPLTAVERKAQMVLREIRQVDLAAELGVTQGTISLVVSGERRSAAIEQAIAQKLGMPVEVVFGPATTEAA